MIKTYSLMPIVMFFFITTNFAQDTYKKNEAIDVKHYLFNLSLNDDNNEIAGESEITIDFKEEMENFSLDLIKKSGVYGMTVTGLYEDGEKANYKHANNKIVIALTKKSRLLEHSKDESVKNIGDA